MNIALLLALVVSIIAVIFAFQNPNEVNVNFLGFQSIPMSLALLLIITFTLGLVTGALGAIPGRLRAVADAKRAHRDLDAAKKHLNASAPVTPASTVTPGTTVDADPYTDRFGEPPHTV